MVGPDGEIRITDAVEELAQTDDVYALKIDGEYHDTGNPGAYLKTLIELALKDEQYGLELKEFLRQKIDN
jgi:UTP--glucose-1-phosphate uridylyltransferase